MEEKALQASDVVKIKRGVVTFLDKKIAKKVLRLREGKLSFNQIEEKLGLSKQNGMTAYRIWKAIVGSGSKAELEKADKLDQRVEQAKAENDRLEEGLRRLKAGDK